MNCPENILESSLNPDLDLDWSVIPHDFQGQVAVSNDADPLQGLHLPYQVPVCLEDGVAHHQFLQGGVGGNSDHLDPLLELSGLGRNAKIAFLVPLQERQDFGKVAPFYHPQKPALEVSSHLGDDARCLSVFDDESPYLPPAVDYPEPRISRDHVAVADAGVLPLHVDLDRGDEEGAAGWLVGKGLHPVLRRSMATCEVR